jgi:hypothetical protein
LCARGHNFGFFGVGGQVGCRDGLQDLFKLLTGLGQLVHGFLQFFTQTKLIPIDFFRINGLEAG